jgi:hypothetical protein
MLKAGHMTVEEVYSQVKQLSRAERAQLVELIERLDPEAPQMLRSDEELEALALEGLDSGFILADDAYWAEKERRVIERLGPA